MQSRFFLIFTIFALTIASVMASGCNPGRDPHVYLLGRLTGFWVESAEKDPKKAKVSKAVANDVKLIPIENRTFYEIEAETGTVKILRPNEVLVVGKIENAAVDPMVVVPTVDYQEFLFQKYSKRVIDRETEQEKELRLARLRESIANQSITIHFVNKDILEFSREFMSIYETDFNTGETATQVKITKKFERLDTSIGQDRLRKIHEKAIEKAVEKSAEVESQPESSSLATE